MIQFLKKIIKPSELTKQEQDNNWAYYRFGKTDEKDSINYQFTKFVLNHYAELEKIKLLLEDEKSKEIFGQLLIYRCLGYKYSKLFTNTQEYQEFINTVDTKPLNALVLEANLIPIRHKFMNIYQPIGTTYKVLATNGFLINFLFNQQYLFSRDGIDIKPAKNDILLDCGACWGDSTIAFADMVGENGKVFAFEFVPENLDIFSKNLELNKQINNITIVKRAVHSKSDEDVHYSSSSSSTTLNDNGAQSVKTMSIDDLVANESLSKVDYIKMDIEGSEYSALIGAKETIKKFKPKLAISIYHKYDDLLELPLLIKEILPEYKLYINHHTIHAEETVLYAII